METDTTGEGGIVAQIFEIDVSGSNIDAAILEDMVRYCFRQIGREKYVSVKELDECHEESWCHICNAPLQYCEKN